jgi:flagellar basal-body rod modification protein FlgD
VTTPVPPATGGLTSGLRPLTPPAKELGKDAFLQLLVAQLKYQNPLSPTDSAQFMAQTAQFTMVEKLEELSKQNAELLTTSRTVGASSLIGRSVVTIGEDGTDVVRTVTGVRLDPSGPVLRTGDTEVPLAGVKEVRPAGG